MRCIVISSGFFRVHPQSVLERPAEEGCEDKGPDNMLGCLYLQNRYFVKYGFASLGRWDQEQKLGRKQGDRDREGAGNRQD